MSILRRRIADHLANAKRDPRSGPSCRFIARAWPCRSMAFSHRKIRLCENCWTTRSWL